MPLAARAVRVDMWSLHSRRRSMFSLLAFISPSLICDRRFSTKCVNFSTASMPRTPEEPFMVCAERKREFIAAWSSGSASSVRRALSIS